MVKFQVHKQKFVSLLLLAFSFFVPQISFAITSQTYSNTISVSIPDNNSAGATSQVSVSSIPSGAAITNFTYGVSIHHTYVGDLRVYIIAPDGTSETIWDNAGGSTDNIYLSGRTTSRFNGLDPNGIWKLKAVDNVSDDVGNIDFWAFKFDYSVTVTVPSINGVSANPNPVNVGVPVTISAQLSGSLPSGYSLKVTFHDGTNWLTTSDTMSAGSNNTYSYTRPQGITQAGSARLYKVEMFNSSGSVVATKQGSITVLEVISNHAPVLTLVTSPPLTIVQNQNFSLSLRATDSDNNLSTIQVNWGDGSNPTPVVQSAIGGQTYTFSHSYSSTGTKGWSARAYDNYSPIASSNQITGSISVTAPPRLCGLSISPYRYS
ncbi:hypothetical protein TI04_04630 [Achromatium sp. WMS2]|nr:hypothetical protein TI04_04630 [Achromatium sp. WMS2]